MTDAKFDLTYVAFNNIEAAFWVLIGLGSLLAGRRFTEFRFLSLFTTVNLVLFGISDILEARLGSFFEPGMAWLFIWKGICVFGLVVSVLWYLNIRRK